MRRPACENEEEKIMNDGIEHRPWRGGLRWTCTLLSTLLLVGCGYGFSGSIRSAYPDIKTVYVDTLTNKTSEPNLENIYRSAFISEIVQRGHFKLVSSRAEAGAVLRGAILNIHVAPLAYKSGTSFSAEDRITVTLELFFEETTKGKTLWSNGGFAGSVDYPVTAVGATESSRRSALTKLASDSAEKVYRLMMSDF
ncbi:MAG: hypothetical protein FJ122_10620 [Deltaproteobacteria bacterium]|nr:hypothetical protein [Deltaproteobacteria bacterium]